MSIKTFPILGTKSSLLWDEDTDAWVYISGEPERTERPSEYYKIIPTLYRAVGKRANAISTLPWALVKGKEDFETSEDYENKTGLVNNMNAMLYLIEASLMLAGSAYLKREKNTFNYDKLRHLNPTSLQLDEKKAVNGEIVWKRNENGMTREYTPKEIVYFWPPDPYVEIGPPSSWPAKTALNACGVLANVDEFAKNYFARGAIKAMLFSMSGASRQTAEEFETWWQRFISGISNVFRTKVINAEKVDPIIVGEGMKELENVTLTDDKQREIAMAFDIPMSMLFADAANYATANQDKLNWYEDTVVPESKLIASILNEQIFKPIGLRFEFRHETLDIFQEDEKERSMALGYLFNAEVPLDIAMRILGFDLDDEQWARIEEQVKKKEEQAEQMIEQLQQGDNANPVGGGAPENPNDDKPDPFEERRSLDLQQIQHELSRWRDKVIKAVERGDSASSIAWVPVAIPGDVYDRVEAGLQAAKDADAVKGVFVNAMREPEEVTETRNDELMDLIQEFKSMTQAIIWKGYP